jgi:hypothetical protein
MPSIEQADCVEDALLWPAFGAGLTAEPRLKSGYGIKVRWVNRAATVLDPQGNTVGVDATLAAKQDIPVGSIVWQGSFATAPLAAISGANAAFLATSMTAAVVQTGPVVFALTQPTPSLLAGMLVSVVDSANATVYMVGTVTSNDADGLAVNVTTAVGSGTVVGWNIGPPVPVSGLMQVITANRARDVRSRGSRYEFGLKRFNGTLPPVMAA